MENKKTQKAFGGWGRPSGLGGKSKKTYFTFPTCEAVAAGVGAASALNPCGIY